LARLHPDEVAGQFMKQYVWIDQRLLNIVAFGGKGQEAPAPPDFSALAQADREAAQNNLELGREQLDWGRNQFNTVWPYAQQYLNDQMSTTDQERNFAGYQQNIYSEDYRPIEHQLTDAASNYNTPARSDANAGAAMADVTNAFAGQRAAALSQLEGYGIDPSQTRFGALDLSSRVQEAAATAAAGTLSRRNTEATGLALQGEAVNIGRGFPGAVAGAYSTATNAGSSRHRRGEPDDPDRLGDDGHALSVRRPPKPGARERGQRRYRWVQRSAERYPAE
jgi:hypothetical protein